MICRRLFLGGVLGLTLAACGGGDDPGTPAAPVDAYVGRWSQCDAGAAKLTVWSFEKVSATAAKLSIVVGSMTGPGCAGLVWDKHTLFESNVKFDGTKDYFNVTWDRIEGQSGDQARKELIAVQQGNLLTSMRTDGSSQGGQNDANGYPDSFSYFRIPRAQ